MIDPGKELTRLRKEKGLTQKALAELTGIGADYIWDIEHGKFPGIEVASKLAWALDVSLNVFWIKRDYQKRTIDKVMAQEQEELGRQFAESPGIEILNLSPRSSNALYGANIETLEDLLSLSEKELSKIRNLGPASQREVKDQLRQYLRANLFGNGCPPEMDKAY